MWKSYNVLQQDTKMALRYAAREAIPRCVLRTGLRTCPTAQISYAGSSEPASQRQTSSHTNDAHCAATRWCCGFAAASDRCSLRGLGSRIICAAECSNGLNRGCSCFAPQMHGAGLQAEALQCSTLARASQQEEQQNAIACVTRLRYNTEPAAVIPWFRDQMSLAAASAACLNLPLTQRALQTSRGAFGECGMRIKRAVRGLSLEK